MKKHFLPLSIIAISVICWLYAYPNLPSEVPIHWNAEGADGFASKWVAFLLINGMLLFVYAMMMIVPKIDPRKKNYKYFSRGYTLIIYSMLIIFAGLSLLTLLAGLGYNIPMEQLAGPVVGLLFIILGNYLQQAKPNFFIGMRTPWTLSNDDVWRKTHRLSSKLFIAGGILMIVSVLLPTSYEVYVIFGVVGITVIIPYVYSYLLYRRIVNE